MKSKQSIVHHSPLSTVLYVQQWKQYRIKSTFYDLTTKVWEFIRKGAKSPVVRASYCGKQGENKKAM